MQDDTPELHVIAAAFPENADAIAAERDLRDRLDVGPNDITVRPAGGDPSRRGLRAFLAGRFRAHRRAEAARVIEEHGGEIVADVLHRMTEPARDGEASRSERRR